MNPHELRFFEIDLRIVRKDPVLGIVDLLHQVGATRTLYHASSSSSEFFHGFRVSQPLSTDLSIPPEIWLFLSFLLGITLFFKFNRIWSFRNLDILLLYALTPGILTLVSSPPGSNWLGYVVLFIGSLFWLIRCLIDLGLPRRPVHEPNLNQAGLVCLTGGILGLLIVEAISLSYVDGVVRNPADSSSPREAVQTMAAMEQSGTDKGRILDGPVGSSFENLIRAAPLPDPLRSKPPRIILSRILVAIEHLGLVVCLVAVGRTHYNQPTAGMAMASCYVILPYTRFGVVDSGQLTPVTLIVLAILLFRRPTWTAILIGVAASWTPACVGLIPLWASFYRRWRWLSFSVIAISIVGGFWIANVTIEPLKRLTESLGARSPSEVGLFPIPPELPDDADSLWASTEAAYRLPVWTAYLVMVVLVTLWPSQKNLGQLIALSALLLVASQFWYLERGGTLVVIYTPLVLLMMFRPTFDRRHHAPESPAAREPKSISAS